MRAAPLPARLAVVLAGLTFAAGCASRASTPAPVPGPTARQTLDAAHQAVREGRPADAQALYARAGDVGAPPDVRREALLAHGLLVLDPAAPARNMDGARGLLAAARALYDGPAPLELTVAMALVDDITALRDSVAALEASIDARTTAEATAEASVQTLAAENQTLKRTVRQLRQDMARKDAALRKAADAVIGTPRSR